MDNKQLRQELYQKMCNDFLALMNQMQELYPSLPTTDQLALGVVAAMKISFDGSCDYIDQCLGLKDENDA